MGGHAAYAHPTVKYSDEKANNTVPNSKHSRLSEKWSAMGDDLGTGH